MQDEPLRDRGTKPSEIDGRLSQLNAETNDLQKTCEELNKRLSRVLRESDNPSTSEDVATPRFTPLGEQINEISSKIGSTVIFLQNILTRLEL